MCVCAQCKRSGKKWYECKHSGVQRERDSKEQRASELCLKHPCSHTHTQSQRERVESQFFRRRAVALTKHTACSRFVRSNQIISNPGSARRRLRRQRIMAIPPFTINTQYLLPSSRFINQARASERPATRRSKLLRPVYLALSGQSVPAVDAINCARSRSTQTPPASLFLSLMHARLWLPLFCLYYTLGP